MKCLSPGSTETSVNGYVVKNTYPCGICINCRITKRQEWTFRLLLEMRLHKYNYFATLTYSDEYITEEHDLDKEEIQRFIKRIRSKINTRIRYFAIGEYGREKGRPHYHILIFSNKELPFYIGRTGNPKIYKNCVLHSCWYPDCIIDCVIIPSTRDGRSIARYISGYTVKKLEEDLSLYKLNGEKFKPEFTLMSRMPGIGLQKQNIDAIVNSITKYNIEPWMVQPENVRTSELHMLRFDGKLWPVGRTLREKIIGRLGGYSFSDNSRKLIAHIKMMDKMYTQTLDEFDARSLEIKGEYNKQVFKLKLIKQHDKI